MALRTIPINAAALGPLPLIQVAEKERRADDGTVSQRVNAAGEPVWAVTVLVQQEGARPDLLEVSVSGQRPQLDPMTPLRFSNLTGRMWEMNGRAGISYSADAVAPSAASPVHKTGGD
ncbi:MAG: hypothetical protein LKI78_03720 [Bifidobacterium tibiigranuli]|nr:hypothetical protein [Bifidobacterium tibiigranuli]